MMDLDFLVSIKDRVDQLKNELVKDLSDLVKIESVTYNEKQAIEHLSQRMKDFGF